MGSNGWRTMVVDDLTYRWKVGKTAVEIRGPKELDKENWTLDRPAPWDLIGNTPELVERGRWKGTSDGMVTPAMVKAFIGKHPAHLESKQENAKLVGL
jgi:hypothetical protein